MSGAGWICWPLWADGLWVMYVEGEAFGFTAVVDDFGDLVPVGSIHA